jgi:hypothetical protein
VLLFCGNKLFRETGTISVPEISVGKRVETECFTVFFNDGTSEILPTGTNIQLINKNFPVNKENNKCFSGTISKYRIRCSVPSFSTPCIDPYIVGLCTCLPVRNKNFHTKQHKLLDLNEIPKDYYSISIKKMSDGYYQIAPEENYPNLLRMDIKKSGNFKKLSERFIPDEYLFSTRESRELFLKGCMDIFGHHRKGETTFECASHQLAKDVSFLIRSIGGFAKIREHKGSSNFYVVSVCFNDDFNPFLLKKTEFRRRKSPRIRSIQEIKSTGILPCLEIPLSKVTLDSFIVVS